VRQEIDSGAAVQFPSTEGVAVLFRPISEELFGRLHDEGQCLFCLWHLDVLNEEEGQPNLARHGLFVYGHLTDNWISGPYGRQQVPRNPVHLDELPPRLRQQVKQLCFETLRFPDTAYIQPVEHAPCESWESTYMDVTGKRIGPIPGREGDYASQHEELRSRIGGMFEIEPPPEPPKDEE
jgi:hypothetical protein